MSILNQFSWILFDADDTLFHFDAFSGLKQVFASFDILFSEQDYQEYQAVNKPLWTLYQQGSVSIEQLKEQRFVTWAQRLNCSPLDLNNSFMTAMATVCQPIDGVLPLIHALKNKVKLGIITNGLNHLQEERLQNTGLNNYFDILVVSEQIGAAKPDRAIFEHALKLMNYPDPQNVLMVGDNPEADIQGGLNVGFSTCWFNQHQKECPPGIVPHYEVTSFYQLHELLV